MTELNCQIILKFEVSDATGKQSAGQQPVGEHAQKAARQQPTCVQATSQASSKKSLLHQEPLC